MKKLLRSKYKEIRRIIIDKEDRDNIIFNKVINNIKVCINKRRSRHYKYNKTFLR